MKRIGSVWSGESRQSGTFTAMNNSLATNIYVLRLTQKLPYISSGQGVMYGFADEADTDSKGLVHFAPAEVDAKIVVVDKQKHLGIPAIPLMIGRGLQGVLPNWHFISLAFMDYVHEAALRESRPADNPFEVYIKHPWYHATISEVTDELFGVPPWTGYLLVDVMSTALVELDPATGTRKVDIFRLHRLKEAQKRQYIVHPDTLFSLSKRHPAEQLCFHSGLFGDAFLYSEGGKWQRGALYGKLKQKA